MPQITLGTIVKLVIASILVGATMAFLGLQPQDIYRWIADKLGDIAQNIQAYTGAAMSYLLLGAVVVVPIWGIFYLIRVLRR